jgi:hypothetical protein
MWCGGTAPVANMSKSLIFTHHVGSINNNINKWVSKDIPVTDHGGS